jgi:hypothetical protein
MGGEGMIFIRGGDRNPVMGVYEAILVDAQCSMFNVQ